MKAILEHHVIAESDDIVESGGYQLFPDTSVHMQWLEEDPQNSLRPRLPAWRPVL